MYNGEISRILKNKSMKKQRMPINRIPAFHSLSNPGYSFSWKIVTTFKKWKQGRILETLISTRFEQTNVYLSSNFISSKSYLLNINTFVHSIDSLIRISRINLMVNILFENICI